VGASFSYTNGENQVNNSIGDGRLSRGWHDPATSLGTQAYLIALTRTSVGAAQTVSTLRFTALSLNYNIPPSLSRRVFLGRQITVTLQGQNLGLLTNYRGKDPNVNASMNEIVRDSGILPQPRTWNFSFRID
jgi:hypothetical protein